MAINNGIRRRNIWKMYRLKLLFFGAVGMSFELAYAYSFLGMGGTADSHLKAFVCSFLAMPSAHQPDRLARRSTPNVFSS